MGGLDEVGLLVTKYVADNGLETWGHYVSPRVVGEVKGNGIMATANWS